MSDNSAVRTAVIGGVFSLVSTIVAALVTGLLGLWGTSSQPTQPMPPIQVTIPLPQAAVSPVPGSTFSQGANPGPVTPVYTLNFQAFQRATRPLDLSDARRAEIVAQVEGRQVVWKGVVGEVVPQDEPKTEIAYCVVLCEDESSIHQVLGSASAKCFFPASAAEQVESLKPGDEVTVMGTFDQHWGALGSRVVNCSLIRR
jgi:hypothetical protein